MTVRISRREHGQDKAGQGEPRRSGIQGRPSWRAFSWAGSRGVGREPGTARAKREQKRRPIPIVEAGIPPKAVRNRVLAHLSQAAEGGRE